MTTPDDKHSHIPEDWPPTQDLLAFSVMDGARSELWMWSLSDRKATRFGTLQSIAPFDAVFSPDGRWLAYSQRVPRAAANSVATYVHSIQSPEIRYSSVATRSQFIIRSGVQTAIR